MLDQTSTSTSTAQSLRDQLIYNGAAQASPSITIKFPRILNYHQRAIAEFGYMSLYFNDQRIMLLLEGNKTGEDLASALRLPLGEDFPPLYLSPNTYIDSLARATGQKSYDLALPYHWVASEYLSRGLPFPRGIWSYANKRVCGEFVSLEDMIKLLSDALIALGADLVFHPPARVIPDDSTSIPQSLLSGLE